MQDSALLDIIMKDSPESKPMDTLLKGKEMTMKELSRRSGIPYRTIQAYNAKTNRPSLDNAVALARHLNCSLLEIAEAFGCDVKGLPYA